MLGSPRLNFMVIWVPRNVLSMSASTGFGFLQGVTCLFPELGGPDGTPKYLSSPDIYIYISMAQTRDPELLDTPQMTKDDTTVSTLNPKPLSPKP